MRGRACCGTFSENTLGANLQLSCFYIQPNYEVHFVFRNGCPSYDCSILIFICSVFFQINVLILNSMDFISNKRTSKRARRRPAPKPQAENNEHHQPAGMRSASFPASTVRPLYNSSEKPVFRSIGLPTAAERANIQLAPPQWTTFVKKMTTPTNENEPSTFHVRSAFELHISGEACKFTCRGRDAAAIVEGIVSSLRAVDAKFEVNNAAGEIRFSAMHRLHTILACFRLYETTPGVIEVAYTRLNGDHIAAASLFFEIVNKTGLCPRQDPPPLLRGPTPHQCCSSRTAQPASADARASASGDARSATSKTEEPHQFEVYLRMMQSPFASEATVGAHSLATFTCGIPHKVCPRPVIFLADLVRIAAAFKQHSSDALEIATANPNGIFPTPHPSLSAAAYLGVAIANIVEASCAASRLPDAQAKQLTDTIGSNLLQLCDVTRTADVHATKLALTTVARLCKASEAMRSRLLQPLRKLLDQAERNEWLKSTVVAIRSSP